MTAVCLGVVTLLDANSVDAGERIAFEPQLRTFSDPNLFTGARVSASGHWQDQRPELAVDGRISLDSYWGCENPPVHLTVDLERDRDLCDRAMGVLGRRSRLSILGRRIVERCRLADAG